MITRVSAPPQNGNGINRYSKKVPVLSIESIDKMPEAIKTRLGISDKFHIDDFFSRPSLHLINQTKTLLHIVIQRMLQKDVQIIRSRYTNKAMGGAEQMTAYPVFMVLKINISMYLLNTISKISTPPYRRKTYVKNWITPWSLLIT